MAGLVGCGTAKDPIGSTLEGPWAELNLPVADGQVEEVTDELAHFRYEGEQVSLQVEARRFRSALVGAGWSQSGQSSLGELQSEQFERSDRDYGLNLVVNEKGRRVDVTLFVRR